MSPMNPRLLRPTSSSLDPDAAVYLNAVAQEDGEQLEPAVRKAINDFVRGCKQDGIWNAIKASCILMGARTLSGALTPIVGAAPTNNGPFVSGDYNRKTGLVGDGTSKTLDINRNNNADPQNNHHQAVFCSTTASNWIFGAPESSGSSHISIFTTVRVRSRASGNHNTGTVASPALLAHTRSQSSAFEWRVGGSSATVTVSSTTPTNSAVHLLSNGGSFFSAARISFYSAGESLDLALLSSRVTTLYDAIGAAIP